MAAATPTVRVPNPFNIPEDIGKDVVGGAIGNVESAVASDFERIAEVIVGLILIAVGVAALLRPTPVGTAASSATKTAKRAGELAAL